MAFRLPETRAEVAAQTANANRLRAQLAAQTENTNRLRAQLAALRAALGQLARDPDARPRAKKRKSKAAATRRTGFADLDRDAVERIADFVDCRFVFKLLCKAARDGTHGPTVTTAEHVGASVARLVWFRGAGLCPFSAHACVAAAVRRGNLEVLQFAYSQPGNGFGWLPPSVMEIAAARNHVKIVQWGCELHRRCGLWLKLEMNTGRMLKAAAAHGHLDVIRYMQSAHHYRLSPQDAMAAARNGHVHILEHCATQNVPMDWTVADQAMVLGHVPVLEWSMRQGMVNHYSIFDEAANLGHVHVLDWAAACGMQPTNETVEYAARGGHLKVLKWLHARGLIGDTNRVLGYSGLSSDVQKWAHEHAVSQ